MKDGFIKVAAAAPTLRVGDPVYNTGQMLDWVRRASLEGVHVLVFPQLSITGYTCGDLFFQSTLIDAAMEELHRLCGETEALDMLIAAGLPVRVGGLLYSCTALVHRGQVLGLVPKSRLEDGKGLTEFRYFSVPRGRMGPVEDCDHAFCDPEMIFRCATLPGLNLGVVPGGNAAGAADLRTRGATLILNPEACPENMTAPSRRRDALRTHTAALGCAFVTAGAGMGESTTDNVYSGHCMIAEAGELVAEARPFSGDWALGEIDLGYLAFLGRKTPACPPPEGGLVIPFDLERRETPLSRVWETTPFVPAGIYGRAARCEHIINIQAWGLKKRMEHIGAKYAVIGVSGGLDSTMALIAIKRAFELMELPPENIRAYTLPCFGTSHRTRSNAGDLCAALGLELKTIDITEAVRRHFADIGQSETDYNVTFENAQARERTQVLMDIANQIGGIVVGTGDLSELALGWATYNGDHMSMYGVNGSIPKTLLRDVIGYLAEAGDNEALFRVLTDILDTPVSPELVPGAGGEIAQKTEDLVGDYRLHDFFLFHHLTRGCGPAKLYRIACRAFEGQFDESAILKWLKVFFRRFLTQQYKRSCSPDGPSVSGVSLSPRGGLVLPSDASFHLWQTELDGLEGK